MSDNDDDKKNINQDSTSGESDNQSLVEENNQSEIEESSNEGSLNDNNAQNYREWKVNEPEKYASFIQLCVKNDIEIVRKKADYLICLWDQNVIKGAGTHAEVTFAYDLKKPVFLINNLPFNQLSGWIMACSSKIFSNFDELKIFLVKEYGNNDRS